MSLLELDAPAKINLSLDVLCRRDDGYHDLRMIMQTVGVHDTVAIETGGSDITVECNSRYVPSGIENTVYKAASLLKTQYGISDGLRIRIVKRIPVAAGLAGGSSDAAAVIKGIDSMFSLGLTPEQLAKAGKAVGADVPYCISGGTMLAEGIGEILTRLTPLKGVDIVILKPKVGVSTAWVYKNLQLDRITERPDTNRLVEAVGSKNIKYIAENMVNVLETVTIPQYPIINTAKEKLIELGAAGSMMSGSGPSVFGIFTDKGKAAAAFEKLKDNNWECFLTQTV